MKQELIKAFANDKFGNIRVVLVDGREYFVATDVARALGYTNPQKAIRDHCKGVNETFIPTNGGKQLAKVIPEGDVYRLITHSKLPSAEEFERWVFDEVLPSIRKTGSYSTGQPQIKEELSPQLQFMINMELEQKKMQQQLDKVKREAEQANRGLTTIKNVMLFNRYNWDTECTILIYSIANGCKQSAQKIREEVYQLVEERGRADLKQRVANKQRRLRAENANEVTINNVDQLNVIADDARLKEIYIGIVKELAFKYGVVLEGD